ncbi:hypothetical protein GCM10022381_32220 [Leifsonia kafniensis]|uniref:Uncharacterized protein n=2 Tax=Leifsonia kafniensis TaxID=475957 RepID=A0ABP7KV86_9MICO
MDPLDDDTAMELRRLAKSFLPELNARIASLHFTIGRELAELGMEAVYKFPDLSTPDVFSVGRVGKRRVN